jgi:hypothetical protein
VRRLKSRPKVSHGSSVFKAVGSKPCGRKDSEPCHLVSAANSVRSEQTSKHEATNFQEFEMKFDPSDKKLQKMKKSVLTSEDSDAEIWCEWREQLDELYLLILLTTASKQKANVVVSL